MIDKDSYYTVLSPSESEFKDRGSKFIAYIEEVKNENEFSVFLEKIRNIHFKARHHCFAYRFLDTNKFRYSDDGEPSGTAGKPIYNQLLSFDLVNVACIVVRYFGGTKLGTSGLINAYKLSTKSAIEKNTIKKMFQQRQIEIKFDYGLMGQLMKTLKHLDIEILATAFDADPSLTIQVKKSLYQQIINEIKGKLLNRSFKDIQDDTEVTGILFE